MNAITSAPDFGLAENMTPISPPRDGVELLYTLHESIFAASAPAMWEMGWKSAFPQQQDRAPASIYNASIRPGDGKDGINLANVEPDARTRDLWISHGGRYNVAVYFGGATSGHTFALDIDVLDEGMAKQIEALAVKMLGYSPLQRVGSPPKIAIIYRTAPDDKMKNMTRRFADADGMPGEHAIEILADNKALTVHGKHHKTGKYFTWPDKNPMLVGPEAAPLVTSAQVDAFMGTLDQLWGFATKAAAPKSGGMAWSPDGTVTGGVKATDGREHNLLCTVNTTITSFDPAFWEAVAAGDKALAAFRDTKLQEVLDRFAKENELSGRWAADLIIGEALPRVDRWIGRLLEKGKPAADKMRTPGAPRRKADAASRPEGDAASRPEGGAMPDNGKPTICVKPGEIGAAVDAAEKALRESARGIYQRAGRLVFVGSVPVETRDGKPIAATKILDRTEPSLMEDLSAVANWGRFDGRAQGIVRTDAPQKVVAALAARVGQWTLPVLDGVITAPTIRADGTILAEPGFDAQTGLLFERQGVAFPEVPEKPTRADAEAALDKLKGLLKTFPFVARHDLSAALSGMLTAVVRRSLDKAPMHAYTAPVPGSGKSLLVDLCCILATGREAAVIAQGGGEEELEKRLSAALLEGDSIVSLDNVEQPLGGAFLNQATTQRYVKPRILGQSKVPEILCNASFYATGNNLTLYADMVRRALLVSLDPQVERPELREFKNDPIADAKRIRGELVVAALTIVRAHVVAGEPGKKPPVGSYDAWSRFVRDPLVWLGEADPWLTTERARELDPKLEAMQTIIAQWRAVLGDKRYTVADVIKRATEQVPIEGQQYGREFSHPEFREALLSVAGEAGNVNSRRLGKWLLAHAGRIVGDARITKGAERGGVATWSVERQGALALERSAGPTVQQQWEAAHPFKASILTD